MPELLSDSRAALQNAAVFAYTILVVALRFIMQSLVRMQRLSLYSIEETLTSLCATAECIGVFLRRSSTLFFTVIGLQATCCGNMTRSALHQLVDEFVDFGAMTAHCTSAAASEMQAQPSADRCDQQTAQTSG